MTTMLKCEASYEIEERILAAPAYPGDFGDPTGGPGRTARVAMARRPRQGACIDA
jgi:hypothetical protein